jgi:8-oxo-dGDP phosphatase
VETLSSRQVYASSWLAVREDTIRRADGWAGVHCVVEAADIALVVPSDGDRLHLVEQYRHPVGGRRWEFPSGSTEPGRDADPAAVGRRELWEETGLTASSLLLLGTLEITPSTMGQRCSVFLATDLTPGAQQPDPEEGDLRSAWFARDDVARMIRDGDLTDAKSIAAYGLLLLSEEPVSRRRGRPSRA